MLSRHVRMPGFAAFAVFSLVALALTGPALVDRGALGPEAILDRDPLYQTAPEPPMPALRDFTGVVIDYPRDLAFADGLWAGRLDRWNPLVGCGTPLWADQGGPFFPLKLPFYLAPSRLTYGLFIALRLVFAAFGAYLLARAQGLSSIGAIAAGATFELSGALTAQLAFGSSSATYVLPWVVLGADQIARKGTWRHVAGAAIALGVTGHGGHPTLAMTQFGAFGAAILGTCLSHWREPGAALRIAGRACVAVLLGLAIAAPALVPLAELSAEGTSYKFHPQGDLIRLSHLSRARQALPVALFAPAMVETFFAQVNTLHPFGVSIGFLALAAALAGFFHRGLNAAMAAVLGLGVALALQPPPFGFLERMPVVSLIQPTYAWSLVVLVLCHSVGRGVQAFGSTGEQRGFLLALLALPVASLSLLLIRDAPDLTSFATVLRETVASRDGMILLLLPHAFAVVAIAVCLAIKRTGLAASVLVSLIIIERLATVLPLTRNLPAEVLSSPPSPAVRFLEERLSAGDSRMMGFPLQVGYPLSPMLFGLPDLRQASALPVRRFHDYLRGVSPEDTTTVLTARVAVSPLLDLAAVRYLVLPRLGVLEVRARFAIQLSEIPKPTDSQMRSVYRDSYVEVFENQAALPRFRIVHQSVAVSDPKAALDWVNSAAEGLKHAEDGVLGNTVVLEPDAEGRDAPAMSFQTAPGESVRIVDQSDPERLLIEVNLVEPGLLVIADTYYPGWTAWVDGTPAPIYPANHLFRAVPVSPGTHRVELRYEPRSFRLGAALFAVAALACAGVFVTSRTR